MRPAGASAKRSPATRNFTRAHRKNAPKLVDLFAHLHYDDDSSAEGGGVANNAVWQRNPMTQHDDTRPEDQVSREAQKLLAEYFRIRREYNSLDRNNPAHAGRRGQLRDRYFALDRRYTLLIRAQAGLENADTPSKPRSKADVLWEGAFADDEPAGDIAPVDAEWIEMHTPVEGRETDEVFEEALRQLGDTPGFQDDLETIVDEPPDESALEADEGEEVFVEVDEDETPVSEDDHDTPEPEMASSLGELDSPNMSAVSALRDIAAGLVDETPHTPTDLPPGVMTRALEPSTPPDLPQLRVPDPLPPAPGGGAPQGVSHARGDFGARKRSAKTDAKAIVCPSCGETLPAGTKSCTKCQTPLGDTTDPEAVRHVTQTALRPPKTYEKPGIGPKVAITFGWLIVLVGAVWLIQRATAFEHERVAQWLEEAGLASLGEPQASTILGVSVVLLGITIVGIGVFAGRFVRLVVPIHELARSGRIDTIEKLILQGEDIDMRDDRGCTPLHFAVVAGQREAVAVLVGNGADPNSHNDRGDTPLHLATANRDHALVQYLISKNAEIEAVNDSGSCLMHVAAWVGDVGLLKLYLEKGLKLDARTKVGFTPLHFAAQGGFQDATAFLLEHGADPDAASNVGTTPLFAAVRNGHLPIVEQLVEAGADLNVRRGRDFESPLGLATTHNRVEIVEYLKAKGALNSDRA